jgi:hypothetical protein
LGTKRQPNSALMLAAQPHVGHAWGAIAQMLRTLNLDVADVIFPWCNLLV